MLKYYRNSLIFTVLGLLGAAALGWFDFHSVQGVLQTVFIVAVLGVLEVSLSFDNAVVNATVLREMDALWRRRFLTWGIAIAVFGMRIVFPLVIVAVIARISPWAAIVLAATDPKEYAAILTSAHVSISAFGGSFLAMVGLKHFMDQEKEIHWIRLIERPLARLGRVEAVQIGVVLALVWAVSTRVHAEEQIVFLVAAIFGLLTYITVDGISAFMEDANDDATEIVARTGLASFLYLEVLDASFSFDGVIGAFALSTNLGVIAIGLGIGAMFVRSMTIMLVDQGTLTQYRYLEHGAFYAIFALGVTMFLQTLYEIPEVVTGLTGAAFIGFALWSSVRYNRKHLGELPIE
ncbi:hypothetical protein LBMAG42_20220 [Deltaproteobacteria bacterium]|nr:hypothetical protein LBMAG42_20220 [Deltaproteobacteria bacterium]